MGLNVIVLAAGQGTRMKSAQPKVLYEIAGKPLVSWILDAVAVVGAERVAVVVGHEAEAVTAVLPAGVDTVLQERQDGTGHATRLAFEALDPGPGDEVMVLPGDTPLVHGTTLAALLETHRADGAAATLLTAEVDDPSGYGRVLRAADGSVVGIVEDRDASPQQLQIGEINAGMYVFDAAALGPALYGLRADNDQNELYLPDVVGAFAGAGAPLAAVSADPAEVMGINSLDQLAEASALMRKRINQGWMRAGVWMLEPDRVYVDASVDIAPGARLYPGVHLEGATSVAAGAEVGPDTHVRDSRIGEDALVRYSVVEGAEVGARALVGPYARLRPGTVLGAAAKAGTFVEIKNTRVGDGAKVPHLAYMGDADIGDGANIGAGTITCNWDGFDKHRTIVGEGAFIGSDTMLVAPVEIGDGAWTAAGSTITKDVPPGALAVERSQQREVPDYAARRKRRRGAERSEDP